MSSSPENLVKSGILKPIGNDSSSTHSGGTLEISRFRPIPPENKLATSPEQNPYISSSQFPEFRAIELENPSPEKFEISPKEPEIPLNPNRPKPRDTRLEHGVVQAVLAVVSRALPCRRRGAQRRKPLFAAAGFLSSAHFVFSVHPLSHGLDPSFFDFCRSSPDDSVQHVRPSPVQSSPAEMTRPQTPDPLRLARDSAQLFPSSAQPLPSAAQLLFGPALLCGPAPAFGPAHPRDGPLPPGPEPVLSVCSVQTASGPVQTP
ncbi:hypothetical protein CRG98_020054 [Punica granatum]|uniref:Uncharacterized protein n=1 Tax=Punica granatum TaxID=22663 RepID=A0A2I0JVM6_PUNGR|nr:hypothetical protein CRG98_020054 [Punica granatum]